MLWKAYRPAKVVFSDNGRRTRSSKSGTVTKSAVRRGSQATSRCEQDPKPPPGEAEGSHGTTAGRREAVGTSPTEVFLTLPQNPKWAA